MPGLLTLGEMADVAALIAPRPILAVHGADDPIYPVSATRTSYGALRRWYEALGASEACRLSVHEGGQRYYKSAVLPFWREHLARAR